MEKKMQSSDILADLENAINLVEGVQSSKIVCHDDEIVEVHVISTKSRAPKQLVRDIETVLHVHGGINIDHKKISVAQVSEGEKVLFRPELVSVGVEANGLAAVVKVALKFEGERIASTVEGAKSEKNLLRLAAQATLSGLERFMAEEVRFAVDQIMLIPIEMSHMISVTVTTVTPQGEELLLGAAYVRGNPLEAACKAALDAVNRRLASLA